MSNLRLTPRVVAQGIFEESASQMGPLGTRVRLDDGREFVYCLNAATALLSGRLVQAPAIVANHAGTGRTVAAAAAVGDRRISVTLGATAATENYYADGVLVVVNDTSAIADAGEAFGISGHAAIASAGTGWINLKDPLHKIVPTTNTVALVRNKHASVIIMPAPKTGTIIGIPPRDVTVSYYAWVQTRGICGCLQDAALVNGNPCTHSDDTPGAVGPLTATQAIDEGPVGMVISNTASGDVGVIDLML